MPWNSLYIVLQPYFRRGLQKQPSFLDKQNSHDNCEYIQALRFSCYDLWTIYEPECLFGERERSDILWLMGAGATSEPNCSAAITIMRAKRESTEICHDCDSNNSEWQTGCTRSKQLVNSPNLPISPISRGIWKCDMVAISQYNGSRQMLRCQISLGRL